MAIGFVLLLINVTIANVLTVPALSDQRDRAEKRGEQNLCITKLEGQAWQHMSQLLFGYIDKDAQAISHERDELSKLVDRFARVDEVCPGP